MAAPEVPLRYVGIDRSSAAFRLMKQMGWEEGEGLGKEKQGIGTEKPNAWAFDTTQFDSILKKLKVQAVEINKDEDDEKDEKKAASKPSPAKENQDAAVKFTRPQGRYKKREKGKLVHAYSSQDLEGILVNRAKSPEIDHAEEVSEEANSIEIHLPDVEGNF
ncbi:UNVERIFIED_CONTAM: G-patch domain-containing protein 1 [Sesamum radiatum]|uniref:G-patch domain-containing protein 1 n=1 Tax=Sesamum radiatum TaxID=300843 RepID=A0AAW2L2R2_SESRA